MKTSANRHLHINEKRNSVRFQIFLFLKADSIILFSQLDSVSMCVRECDCLRVCEWVSECVWACMGVHQDVKGREWEKERETHSFKPYLAEERFRRGWGEKERLKYACTKSNTSCFYVLYRTIEFHSFPLASCHPCSRPRTRTHTHFRTHTHTHSPFLFLIVALRPHLSPRISHVFVSTTSKCERRLSACVWVRAQKCVCEAERERLTECCRSNIQGRENSQVEGLSLWTLNTPEPFLYVSRPHWVTASWRLETQ